MLLALHEICHFLGVKLEVVSPASFLCILSCVSRGPTCQIPCSN